MCSSFRATLFRSIPLSACVLTGLCGCAKAPPPWNGVSAHEAGVGGPADTAAPVSGTVVIAAATPTLRPTPGLGTSYWSWVPTWGDLIAGTEAQVLTLAPFVVRVGGYNNDTNTPDTFDDTQMDKAVAYAQAIHADLIVQVPLLATTNADAGAAAGPATAAAMVQYANLAKGYGIKYFSVGNEPDLYPDAKGSTMGIVGYTPEAYCATAELYVAAMKAVDGTIKIVGPDLSWKYQIGGNDWLTPILTTCGSLFDIVAVHRYPIDPAQTTVANAAADAPKLRGVIAHLQSILQATGIDKPLAITECNITWNGDPANPVLPASPGTVPAGLWAADAFGVGLESRLWATVFWSTREGWTLGLFAAADGTPQPEYWALDLYAEHFGPALVSVSSTPAGVHAYASRNQAVDGTQFTQVIVVNWNDAPAALTFTVDGLATVPAAPTFAFPALTVGAIEIPDVGTASAWIYGETQHQAHLPPQPLPGP